MLSNTQKAILGLIIANLIWGAASPIFKWSLQSIHPFTLAFLRFFIGALVLLPFLDPKNISIKRADWKYVFLLGFFGVNLNIGFFFLGLLITPSINAPIIASAGPIFLTIAAILFLKEHPQPKKIVGGLTGLLGVLLILFQPIIESGFKGSVLGNTFLLLATFASLVPVFIIKAIGKKYSITLLIFWEFVISSILFLPFVIHELTNYVLIFDQKAIVGIIFGAVFASAIAYVFSSWAIKYLPAADVGIFTYIDPMVAILIAIPLLGEIPTATFLVGSLLVFGGIYIAEGRIHYHPIHKLRM